MSARNSSASVSGERGNPSVLSTNEATKIINKSETCSCGCAGRDPWHRRSYKRVVRGIEPLSRGVFEGFRSWKRQDDLYDQGRTLPGQIVTNAQGGQGYHNYALACDIIFKQGKWNPPSPSWWDDFGTTAKKYGLEWGGDWEFADTPHVQLRPSDVTWQELRPYFKD